jgi:hypothetical protein
MDTGMMQPGGMMSQQQQSQPQMVSASGMAMANPGTLTMAGGTMTMANGKDFFFGLFFSLEDLRHRSDVDLS